MSDAIESAQVFAWRVSQTDAFGSTHSMVDLIALITERDAAIRADERARVIEKIRLRANGTSGGMAMYLRALADEIFALATESQTAGEEE